VLACVLGFAFCLWVVARSHSSSRVCRYLCWVLFGHLRVSTAEFLARLYSLFGRSELHLEFEEDRRQQWPLPLVHTDLKGSR